MQAFQQPVSLTEFAPMEPGDEKLFVQFYLGSIRNEEKSTEAGHPVFDAVPFVKIMVPGDKNTVIDTTVDERHKRRFAKMWHQFQQGQSPEGMSGMPLKDWPAVTRAVVEELNHLNIFTVEQLASVADVYVGKIMGIHELRRKAQVYLEQAKDSALALKMSEENQQLRNQLNANEQELKRLSAIVEAMQATQPPKAQDGVSAGTRANRSG
jgi:ribosomal protein L10